MVHVFHARFCAAAFGKIHCRHGNRSCGMDVRENIAVRAQENRVRGHAHVRLKIGGGLAIFIFHAKAEPVRPAGFERMLF